MLFETKEKADNFMRFNNSAMDPKYMKTPKRSYYCSFCCGWHITNISDEKFAKSRDEKDGLLWDSIRVAAKEKDLQIKTPKATVSKPQEKPSKPNKEKAEPCEEKRQRDEIINLISQNLIKVHVLLNQTDFENSQALIEDSEAKYIRAVKLTEKHNLTVSRLQATRAKIDKVTSWLNSLVSLQRDTERQEELINELARGYGNRAYIRMLTSLKNREKIINYVEAITTAVARDDYAEVQKYLNLIESLVLHGFGGGGCVVNRKWAKQQLDLAKKITEQKYVKTMNLQERLLSIIDTIERASALLENGKAKDAVALVDSAQSEIENIEKNYIALIKKSIRSIKKAATNIDKKDVDME